MEDCEYRYRLASWREPAPLQQDRSYGGDEIAILMQNYSLPEAEVLAERLRIQVARVRGASNPPAVTASIGVATFPEPVSDAKVLFKSADGAAYAAKNDGRNRVRTAGGSAAEVQARPETQPSLG